jgi:hypothetical protein
MASKYYHRFAYRWEGRSDRKTEIHKMRDADAFNELSPVLQDLGYEYGRLIINTPIPKPPQLIRVEEGFLRPQDLIVLTTRPPIDDAASDALKQLPRSYTALEEKIMREMRKCFPICARDRIEIAPHLAGHLPPRFQDRANMVFRQKGGAEYRFLRKNGSLKWQEYDQTPRTALFLVHDLEPWPGGPRLLAAFGVGGNETLVWAHLLRKKYWRELNIDDSRFVMMEMTTVKIPDQPDDLSFADDLKLELLLNVPIGKLAPVAGN